MKLIKKVKEEQLLFNFDFSCSAIESRYYREGAQDLIARLVPASILHPKGELQLMQARALFADMMPLISWSDLSKGPCAFSVLLLCKYRFNGAHFFYEMISRFLLPQKKLKVELYFTSDVTIHHLTNDLLSVAEIVVQLKSVQEVEEVKRNIQALETEIRLGVESPFHARRILEFKGLSNDGKTAMIQEKIGSLIQSHGQEFDKGIFSQMQQFLVSCTDGFKNERDYHHISRIISNLYSLRKLLKQNLDSNSQKRYVQVKFLKTQLVKEGKPSIFAPSEELCFNDRSKDDNPLFCSQITPKPKYVLGVLVGLNFLHEHEVFETSHLLAAITKHFPLVESVEGTYFVDRSTDSPLQTIYLEIQKPDGSDFLFEEVQLLRNSLPEQIKSHIEQLAHPIFMPRNEEEVLRNIMSLSRQLRFVNDIPQVIISFDEQKDRSLGFTVILLRVSSANAPTLLEVFNQSQSPLQYIPDRVRRVGHLRKKYVKEATVFRTHVPVEPYLRVDGSIDLYKARQYIFHELCKLIGDVRDYNGGMIYKQTELLDSLKNVLGKIASSCDVLLQKFYYAINPIEMRTSLDVDHLKHFFLLFLQATKTLEGMHKKNSDFLFKQESSRVMAIVPVDNRKKKFLQEKVASLSLPVHQFVTVSLEVDHSQYIGYLLLSEDKILQAKFIESLDV